MRVLHVAAEAFPLVKTGGLADVAAALPQALNALPGMEARLLLPAYPAVREALAGAKKVCELGTVFNTPNVQLLRARMPGSGLPLYLVNAPALYGREGGPYQNSKGEAWPDNALRFALLGWVGAHLVTSELDATWQPDLLHAHDWHAALACAYLQAQGAAARSVFTVHNLAFQGLFALADAPLLGLPAHQCSPRGLEFHGQASFMKAALKFAGRITTVSPTYAREITTHEFGCGLEGVLRGRAKHLRGILNGIDEKLWNPATDSALAQRYEPLAMSGKAACKSALQSELGLSVQTHAPLFAVVSRLTGQKGIDLLLAVLPQLLATGAQLVVQGEGEAALEAALATAAKLHPGQLALRLGYEEARAHRIIAGADVVLVPSRFEPCGLTQMYGMRYGSLPLVRRVGGLADTVHEASGGEGTGFVFEEAEAAQLWAAMERALTLWHGAFPAWQSMQQRGMTQPLGWQNSARAFAELYEDLLNSD